MVEVYTNSTIDARADAEPGRADLAGQYVNHQRQTLVAKILTAARSFDFPEVDQAVLSVGQISEIVSSPFCKNISLHISGNQNYKFRCLIPKEGRWPSPPNVGMGCGGRFCSGARERADD
jgi:hypothetical protein